MKKGNHPKKNSRLSAGRRTRRLPASIPLFRYATDYWPINQRYYFDPNGNSITQLYNPNSDTLDYRPNETKLGTHVRHHTHKKGQHSLVESVALKAPKRAFVLHVESLTHRTSTADKNRGCPPSGRNPLTKLWP